MNRATLTEVIDYVEAHAPAERDYIRWAVMTPSRPLAWRIALLRVAYAEHLYWVGWFRPWEERMRAEIARLEGRHG